MWGYLISIACLFFSFSLCSSDIILLLSSDEVPALEDEEFASKIEILYADLPVFARYRHKLTGLKWGHTAWNGRYIFKY